MEAEEAQRFPLFKEYDFVLKIGSSLNGGSGILLFPRGDLYVPKQYGFGELNLAPYIQEPFNEGKKITLKELITELKDESELSLSSNSLGSKEWFLQLVINRFAKNEIIKVDRRFSDKYKLSNEDIISKGQNYDLTRVFNMVSRQREGLDNFTKRRHFSN